MDIEEQITNVFWCDANMVLDYEYFGDVVSLDTTYCTNHANRPLALFSGFNHHRGSVIFGATLLYDETIESFKWLFETFLQAHNEKKPKTVFTDQDQAMSRALAEVMPETYHGLCTWHLLQNGITHLGNLMKGGSYFLRDFKKCMYDFDTEEDFETAWTNLLNNYNLHENRWIKSIYVIKRKWASCYMKKAFTLGMRSTQLSESLNAHFKSGMKPNVDIMQFFKHFEQVVEEKRGNELTCEYESKHKLARLRYETSPILIQMGKVYTHAVFDLFQNEFKLFLAMSIRERSESHSLCQYIITMANHERSWKVSFDRVSSSVSCSCRKFETFGILCSHALKLFEANDVKAVPDEYILRRWTIEARCAVVQYLRGKEVEGDSKLSMAQKFRNVVSKFIRVAADASPYEECLEVLDNTIDFMSKQLKEFRLQAQNNDSDNLLLVTNDVMQPNGFKIRAGSKRQTRRKSWVEIMQNRKKNVQPRRKQNCPISQDKEVTSHVSNEVTCSAPPTYESTQTQNGQFSFMAYLKASLNDTSIATLD